MIEDEPAVVEAEVRHRVAWVMRPLIAALLCNWAEAWAPKGAPVAVLNLLVLAFLVWAFHRYRAATRRVR